MKAGRESRARLRRLEKRLRELQDAYYDGDSKPESTSVQYLQVLAEARSLAREGEPESPALLKLHLGCGAHRLDGWHNVDLVIAPAVDVRIDCSGELPFRTGAIAFIHTEDLIEHLDLPGGRKLLGECFRILRPGGVLRLLTPDLAALIRKVYEHRDARHLAWCARELSASGPCESLNMHLRMNGEHRFVYDEAYLREMLADAGFRTRRVRWNRSAHPQLRYLDLRDFGLNLFFEATKPGV